MAKESAKLAVSVGYDGDGEFSFSDYPQTRKKIDTLLDYYSDNMQTVVYSGISDEWKNSNDLQDLLARKVIGSYTRKVGETKEKMYYERNNAALQAFKKRQVKGLNLSQRIWNQREDVKQNLEKALAVGIEKGMSAVKLSKRVSQYLNDYPSLKKDYKKKYGKAIDVAACEYRSVRLARNEINMAYRSAEQDRWQKMDYIKGKEIKTTNGIKHQGDMCDELAGVYPKNFYWTGWHVNCMCYAIPIVMSEEEYWGGLQPEDVMPDKFEHWVNTNKDKVHKSSYISKYIINTKEFQDPKEPNIGFQNTKEVREKLNDLIRKTLNEKFRDVQLSNGRTAKRLYLVNGNAEYVVGRKFFSETMAKNIRNPQLSETIQLATSVSNWFPVAKFVRTEDGIHHKCKFKVFSAEYQGKKIECKAKCEDEDILYTMKLLK